MPQLMRLSGQAHIGPTVPALAAVRAVPVPAARPERLRLQPVLAALPAVPTPDQSPLLMPGLHLRGAPLTRTLGRNLNRTCQQGKHR